MSQFSDFAARWSGGCGSGQCASARRICLARGSVPCDVLFIGEAPGESEDVIGRPFVGPAGKLLDRIIARGLAGLRYCTVCLRGHVYRRFPSAENPTLCDNGHGLEDSALVRYALTNLVCCIPREDGNKATEPDDDQVTACSPRLREFVAIARPRLVVRVGKLAKDWLDSGWKHSIKFDPPVPALDMVHPAAILRANVAQRGLAVQRCVVTLRAHAEDMFQAQ